LLLFCFSYNALHPRLHIWISLTPEREPLLKSILIPFSFIFAFAVGCSTVKHMPGPFPGDSEKSSDYTVITYIHGDSDYLFHDKDGRAVQADENALIKIRRSAQRARNGEYIIFHQQQQKKLLWIFPRRNSKIYHYKNGQLVNQLSYRIGSESESFLETESKIFRDLTLFESGHANRLFFLFFGHEIPLFPGDTYHRSHPDIEVHTESFSEGIQQFIPKGDRFDLVALSTCNNGTPAMIHHLRGVSDIVLASPQNLHLSHLDTGQFSLLETEPGLSSRKLAEAVAENTFDRLTDTVQTAITLSVYDSEHLRSYISDLHVQTNNFIEQETPNLYRDNVDCSKLSFFDSKEFKSGVVTLFRPAAFGRDAGDSEHSGWGCKGI